MRRDSVQDADSPITGGRFFVSHDAPTPLIDVATWRLEIFGTGLRGRPDADHAVPFTYDDLLVLPARTITAKLGCGGRGPAVFDARDKEPVAGPPLGRGVAGAAQWTGPLLYDVLELAGITFDAASMLAEGLDEPVPRREVDPGHFRAPLPVERALDDVLVAYAMNGQRLSREHGFPARLIVPESEVDSVKWLGRIEVSNRPASMR